MDLKKIVGINTVNYGSTGKLMLGLAEQARNDGFSYWTFCQDGHAQIRDIPGHAFIGNWVEKRLSDAVNTVTGCQGALNCFGTKQFLQELDQIQPDLIHLHNLHSNFINLHQLFSYIKDRNIPVVWTLHDCWAFTGHCPHFVTVSCDKWKTSCHDCPLYREYPSALVDRSKQMYTKKKNMFTGVTNMKLVTPSKWMQDFLPDSFLREYPSQVIYNGIDLNVFRYRNSTFRQEHALEDKFIILGVASPWTNQKGLDRMERLAGQLDDSCRIVLVGTKHTDSDRIICVPRTSDQRELAGIYSSANVLLNPSRVESFGLVNVEALACGTPVLSYGAGGNAETFDDSCGRLVTDDTVLAVIHDLQHNNMIPKENCMAFTQRFDIRTMYRQYLELYQNMLNY